MMQMLFASVGGVPGSEAEGQQTAPATPAREATADNPQPQQQGSLHELEEEGAGAGAGAAGGEFDPQTPMRASAAEGLMTPPAAVPPFAPPQMGDIAMLDELGAPDDDWSVLHAQPPPRPLCAGLGHA
jgi:hypothetical protein